MIVVIAHYRTMPEHVDLVRTVLSGHAATSEQEPGCLTFRAHQNRDDPTRFVLYEAYATQEAFDEHRRSQQFKDNIESLVAPLLLERSWSTYDAPLTEGSTSR